MLRAEPAGAGGGSVEGGRWQGGAWAGGSRVGRVSLGQEDRADRYKLVGGLEKFLFVHILFGIYTQLN